MLNDYRPLVEAQQVMGHTLEFDCGLLTPVEIAFLTAIGMYTK